MGASQPPKVFVRAASGLRRDWSPLDAFIYNVLTGAVWGGGFVFVGSQIFPAFLPNANMALGTFYAFIGSIPLAIAIAIFASAMPRAGGDYVWLSRVIHPAIGFALPNVAITVFWAGWLSANGLNGVNFIANGLYFLGWQGALEFANSTTGQATLVTISIIIPMIIVTLGMKFASKMLKLFAITGISSTIIVLAIMAASTQQMFTSAVGASEVNTVIATAKAAGWGQNLPSPEISTLIFMAWIFGQVSVGPAIISAHLGEVKGVDKLKNTIFFSLGGLVLLAVFMIGLFALIPNTFGDYWGALNFLYFTGQGKGLVPPTFGGPYYAFYAARVIGGQLLFIFFMITLFVQNLMFYQMINFYSSVKYTFAAAFDGVLPRIVSYVHPRTRSPLVALLIIAIGGFTWFILTILNPAWLIYRAISANVFSQLIWTMGMTVAVMLLPFRAKKVFELSPIGKRGKPLAITAGALGTLFHLYIIWIFATQPALGATFLPAQIVVALFYIAFITFYFIAWAIRKSQGIDIGLAFKELPPE